MKTLDFCKEFSKMFQTNIIEDTKLSNILNPFLLTSESILLSTVNWHNKALESNNN